MRGLKLAVDYINYKQRTKKEVIDYLMKKNIEKDDIEEVINILEENFLINDIAYVKEYIRYALEKRRGAYRIKRELGSKGISSFDIEDGIYEFENQEDIDFHKIQLENAVKERERFISNYGLDKKVKEKVIRRLNYLGYGSSIIIKVVNEVSWERNG